MDSQHPAFGIGAVSARTGLSPAVLRVWERRYGAVVPGRGDSGHRLYTERDIARLSAIRALVDAGHRIGTIARLPDGELERLVSSLPSRPTVPAVRAVGGPVSLDPALDAVAALDGDSLLACVEGASMRLSRVALLDEFLVPLMHAIGDRCANGSLRTVHEHLATAVIRGYLENMHAAYPPDASSPAILISTPAGQHHELGALLVAVTARSEGWNATYLGPNLPAEEIATAAVTRSAGAVALSITFPPDDPQLSAEFARLHRLLPASITLLVGGRSAPAYASALQAAEAVIVGSLAELRARLHQLRESGAGRQGPLAPASAS